MDRTRKNRFPFLAGSRLGVPTNKRHNKYFTQETDISVKDKIGLNVWEWTIFGFWKKYVQTLAIRSLV